MSPDRTFRDLISKGTAVSPFLVLCVINAPKSRFFFMWHDIPRSYLLFQVLLSFGGMTIADAKALEDNIVRAPG